MVIIAALAPSTVEGSEGWLKTYTEFFDGYLDPVLDMDLYGNTAQLPRGVFSFKVEYNRRRAQSRRDDHGGQIDLVRPILLGDKDNPMLEMDFGAEGQGGGVALQFAYGFTDRVNVYVELPFQYMDIQMRPKLRRLNALTAAFINGGLPAGYPAFDLNWLETPADPTKAARVKEEYLNEASAWLMGYMTRLGRPPLGDPGDYREDLGPGKAFHSDGLMLADVNLGLSWNFFRNRRWSGGLIGRLIFPTGNVADPNNSVQLATGADIGRGTGSFGVGFTQAYDLRLFKHKHWFDAILAAEFKGAYYFASSRRYPDFPKPTPDAEAILDQVDPERSFLPDMSDLSGTSYVQTPGFGCDVGLSLMLSSLIFEGAVMLGYAYAQEPELEADPRFKSMVSNFEMQLAGTYNILRVAGGINLVPLYIPLRISYRWEKNIGGRNTLIFDNNHTITIKGYLPTVF